MRTKLLSLVCLMSVTALAQTRQETILTDGWSFSHDKQSWQTVSVPHDWAIAGPFDKKWDLQMVAIEQNGEKEATEKSGRSGGLPWIGEGHYKRNISIPANCNHAELLFDGAMAEPRVSINGQEAGYWAYGYNTFRVDITPFMKAGENLLEVDLQNVEESSRWYPGAGIYRPVTLITTGDDWIDPWKTFIRTRELTTDKAIVDLTIGSGSPLDAQLGFEVELRDAKGKLVGTRHIPLPRALVELGVHMDLVIVGDIGGSQISARRRKFLFLRRRRWRRFRFGLFLTSRHQDDGRDGKQREQ